MSSPFYKKAANEDKALQQRLLSGDASLKAASIMLIGSLCASSEAFTTLFLAEDIAGNEGTRYIMYVY